MDFSWGFYYSNVPYRRFKPLHYYLHPPPPLFSPPLPFIVLHCMKEKIEIAATLSEVIFVEGIRSLNDVRCTISEQELNISDLVRVRDMEESSNSTY